MTNVLLTFKKKIARSLMKDNKGTDKKSQWAHQNYHTMKLNKTTT